MLEETAEPIKNQVYENILKQCERENVLFEDPEFPAVLTSLADESCGAAVEWKRPKDITTEPKFKMDSATHYDVIQGGLEDCWFLAAAAFLTQKSDIFKFVVPPEQNFKTGVFHFRFWDIGDEKWLDVVIDDRLPVQEDKNNNTWNVLYAKPGKDKQYWCPLLEKAFAKLCGSYKELKGGNVSEGLQCLTRYNCTEIEIPMDIQTMLSYIEKGVTDGSLVCFNVKKDEEKFRKRHLYTISKVSHSEGQYSLKVHSPSFEMYDTMSSRKSEDNGEELLPIQTLCKIGLTLYVSCQNNLQRHK